MANMPVNKKMHHLMGWICLSRPPSMIGTYLNELNGIINLTMMLICNHMSMIQAMQHPSYQLRY